MKFNWGTGIFLAYTIFALSMFWAVYQSTKHDNSLVVDNYYEEDLKYQQRFERIANANALSSPVGVAYDRAAKAVVLSFPAEVGQAVGEVQFYRPSDRRLDFATPLQLDEAGRQAVASDKLVGGRWVVKISWEAQGKGYYVEKDLMAPQL